MPATTQPRLVAALDHAAAGRRVFPVWWPLPSGACACGKAACTNAGKHPVGTLVPRGVLDATTNAATIRNWWHRFPDANIGVATGRTSGFVVLDVDVRRDGQASLAALETEYGPLPPTWRALTGSGGTHILFAAPGQTVPNAEAIRPGLDVRGDGGYIVAPGSQHASGGVYEWDGDAHPADGPLAPLPPWLLDLLTPAETFHTPLDTAAVLEGVPIGERDRTLFRLAAKLRHADVPFTFADRLISEAAANCDPPFDARQAHAKVLSAYKRYEPTIDPELRFHTNGHTDGGQAPPGTATPPTRSPDELGPIECNETDVGNGQRLIYWHGENIRYVHQWACWIVWDGTRWRKDSAGAVYAMAKDTAHRIYTHEAHILGEIATAANERPDKTDQETQAAASALARYKSRLSWASKSENRSRLEAMMTLAQSEPGIPITPADLDTDGWLLNCTNGTLDLRSGMLLAHDRAHLVSKTTGVTYDVDAPSPTWDRFLARVLGGDGELMAFLQRAAGYSATGKIRSHDLFFLFGKGANGKGSFVGALRVALGEYASEAAPDLLLEKKGDQGHPTSLADLFGKRLVTASENNDDGKHLAEALVKRLTGGDAIKARRLYEDFWEFAPTHKFWLSANYKPEIRGTDLGIWRRIKLIPFEVTIPLAEQDGAFSEKLAAEAAGILAWIVRGCLMWQEQGLDIPERVRAATDAYRSEMDRLKPWMDDCCTIGVQCQARAGELYTSFSAWQARNGERAISASTFGRQLVDRGFTRVIAKRGHYWRGIGLVTTETQGTF